MNSDIERIQNNVHCYESVSLANDDVCTALGIIRQQAEQIAAHFVGGWSV